MIIETSGAVIVGEESCVGERGAHDAGPSGGEALVPSERDQIHALVVGVRVAGAGALAEEAGESPEELRINVTSPNGTTQAGLEVLMDPVTGLPPLMEKTVAAATDRSKELRNG